MSALAREVFGGEDPVGRDRPDDGGPPEGEARRATRVVGVVAAYRERNVYSAAKPFAIFRTDLSNPADSAPSRIVVRLRPGTPRAFEEKLVTTLEATLGEWSLTAEPLEVTRGSAARRMKALKGRSSGHEYWLFPADNLAGGPVCKLGHPELINSTLFHGVYIPGSPGWNHRKHVPPYRVSLRDDYPEDELKKWGNEVLSLFRDEIWPCFEPGKSNQMDKNS